MNVQLAGLPRAFHGTYLILGSGRAAGRSRRGRTRAGRGRAVGPRRLSHLRLTELSTARTRAPATRPGRRSGPGGEQPALDRRAAGRDEDLPDRRYGVRVVYAGRARPRRRRVASLRSSQPDHFCNSGRQCASALRWASISARSAAVCSDVVHRPFCWRYPSFFQAPSCVGSSRTTAEKVGRRLGPSGRFIRTTRPVASVPGRCRESCRGGCGKGPASRPRGVAPVLIDDHVRQSPLSLVGDLAQQATGSGMVGVDLERDRQMLVTLGISDREPRSTTRAGPEHRRRGPTRAAADSIGAPDPREQEDPPARPSEDLRARVARRETSLGHPMPSASDGIRAY